MPFPLITFEAAAESLEICLIKNTYLAVLELPFREVLSDKEYDASYGDIRPASKFTRRP